MKLAIAIGSLFLIITGCASYVTPGRGADLATVGAPATTLARNQPPADPIEQAFQKRPMARFPTAVAVVRVQAPGYMSRTAQGWGHGRYSIVTMRDVENPEQVERLAKLPQVRGIAPVSRLLIGDPNLTSDLPLRQAAAQLQADVLLVYTLDTTFTTEDKARPLSAVSLGLSPNKQVRVMTTASAVLLDTRNGYVYGLSEATAQENRMTNAWQNSVAIDETRRAAESAAFDKLIGELETTWKRVISTYASADAAR